MEWKYTSQVEKSTGYEDKIEELSKYTKEYVESLSVDDREKVISDLTDFYLERNIFPIYYFNDEGVRKEIQRCFDFEASIKDGGVVNCGAGVGTDLCNFLFPNLYDTYNVTNIRPNCVEFLETYKKFNTRKMVERYVKFAIFGCSGGCIPQNVMAGIRILATIPTNFRPMNAKAIFEKYCPENGVIYDFSAGYGGRMLGCLTSKKNFTYIACEPNSETFRNLNKLGNSIESVSGRKGSFKILQIGSEDFRGNKDIFDFAFSSPPYFNLEHYSDEITQCYNKYPNIYDWMEKYVLRTIENIYYMLKPNCYYAVNIADFTYADGRFMNYVEIWKKYSEKVGFKYVDKLTLSLSSRQVRSVDTRHKKDSEGIYIFYKG